MAPTCARLEGSMMMPEPIMLTATMKVSCVTFIFFCGSAMTAPLFLADDVGMELDAALDALLVDALHLVVEAREAVERVLEGAEVLEHRPRARVPALARHHDADARRIDERERGRDAPLHLVERDVVDLVG